MVKLVQRDRSHPTDADMPHWRTTRFAPEPSVRVVPRDHPQTRGQEGILIIDDPHAPDTNPQPTNPQDAATRQDIKDWYTRTGLQAASIPYAPSKDILGIEADYLCNAASCRGVTPPTDQSIMASQECLLEDSRRAINMATKVNVEEFWEQPVDIDGAVTQRAVDELFEVYNRHDNNSGPGPTSPTAGLQLPVTMAVVEAEALRTASDAYQKRYNTPDLPRVDAKMCECGHAELDHDEPPDRRTCFGLVGSFTLCSCLDFKAKP